MQWEIEGNDELTRKHNLSTGMDDLAVQGQEDERNLFGRRATDERGQGTFWNKQRDNED